MKKNLEGTLNKTTKWLVVGLSGTAVLTAAFAAVPAIAGSGASEGKGTYSYVVEDAEKSDYPSPERLDEMFVENDRLYEELIREQETTP